MTRRIFIAIVALVMAGVVMPGSASADEIADLKANFKKRYPALKKLMDAGSIGERWDGYVHVRTTVEEDATALIAQENQDRRRLYEIIAAKRGIKPSEVGVLNGVENFKRAEPDHWIQARDRDWVQKKNAKIEG